MNKFRQWYLYNQIEITWFLIGFLVATGFDSLGKHDYVSALLNFGLAFVNYFLSKK